MVNLTINNRKIQAKPGTTILEAAQAAGERIPTLCHIKELFPSGACRICVVEVKGKPNLTPSCAFPVEEGMEIQTRSPRVINARRVIIELLLASHPFDCLTCPKNGYCELQSLSSEYGIDRCPTRARPATTTRTSPLRPSSESPTSASSAAAACGSVKRSREWPPSTSLTGASTPWCFAVRDGPERDHLRELRSVHAGVPHGRAARGARGGEGDADAPGGEEVPRGPGGSRHPRLPGDFFGLPAGRTSPGRWPRRFGAWVSARCSTPTSPRTSRSWRKALSWWTASRRGEASPVHLLLPGLGQVRGDLLPRAAPEYLHLQVTTGDDGGHHQELPCAEAEHRPQGHLRGLGDALHGEEVRGGAPRALVGDRGGRR